MKLAKPTNQTAEVLHELIKNKSINKRDMLKNTGILSLTAQITFLRNKHNIAINCERISTENKFGRSISFGVWSVSKKLCDQKKLVATYNKINNG
jgi:hypothetical protein